MGVGIDPEQDVVVEAHSGGTLIRDERHSFTERRSEFGIHESATGFCPGHYRAIADHRLGK